MRNIDLYKDERDKATIQDGLKILRGMNIKEKPCVKIWRPKAKKPFISYYFQTTDRMEDYINKIIEGFKADMERKEKRKQERKGNPELLKQADPGAIFHFSWGYDQTQCDYFQVIERRGQMVKVQRIASESVKGSEGHMSDNRTAVKDSFLTDHKVLTKKVQFSSGTPYLTMASYGWCSLWDGKPKYCSWYA
jgi:hypothetical protein